MKLRSLADFVTNRIKSAEKNPLSHKRQLPVLSMRSGDGASRQASPK